MQAWLKIRRNQAIAGGLVVVLLGAGFFLTRGGGDTTIAPITLPSSQPGGGQPTATPSSRHHKTPKSTLVLTGRNPFQCIVCPPAPQTSPTAPAPNVAPNVITNNGLYAGGANTNVSGHSVTLLSTFRKQGILHAHVTVDANTYAPMVGQRFATNFKLVSAGGGCARILYGDSSFTLCV
jgi:hypothetical protein